MVIAAVHESGFGPSRHAAYAAAFGRFRGIADIERNWVKLHRSRMTHFGTLPTRLNRTVAEAPTCCSSG